MQLSDITAFGRADVVRDGHARLGRSIYLVAIVVLVVGIAVSVLSFWFVKENVQNEARLKFERQASDAHHSIEARIRSYTNIVYGLRALMYSSGAITRRQFHDYVVGLELQHRFPGFLNLNYAVQVPGAKKKAFEQAVRADTTLDPQGYPAFAVRPPGERSYYHVVTYLEPMKGNELSFGRDIVAVPAIRELFERRIFASNELASSGRPPRIEGPPPFWGIAMRLPLYRQDVPTDTLEQRRAAIVGTLGAGFRIDELLQHVLDESTLVTLRFKVYDAGQASEESAPAKKEERLLLFDSADPTAAPEVAQKSLDEPAALESVLPLALAGRMWEIQYTSRTGFVSRTDAALPYLVLIGGLVVSLLMFGTAYSLASSRSRAVALAQEMTHELRQNEIALRNSAETLKAVSRRLLEVQEAERRMLAGELHDRVGANLSALSVNINLIAARTDQANPQIAGHVEDSNLLIEETADAIRNVMGELRPLSIDEYGLLSPLRSIAERLSHRNGMSIKVEGNGPVVRAPRSVEVAMFRIAQEALNNVGKYAKARNVHIAYTGLNGTTALTIEDDGVGFDPDKLVGPRADSGWGLLIMRERAEAAGARFSVESRPGKGTKIVIEYHA